MGLWVVCGVSTRVRGGSVMSLWVHGCLWGSLWACGGLWVVCGVSPWVCGVPVGPWVVCEGLPVGLCGPHGSVGV